MDSRPDRDHFWTRKDPSVGGFPQGRALDQPGVEVRPENYEDYRPVTKSSGIVSIEVFERFTRLSLSATEKVAIHLRFFERCHDWLNRGSRLSLQYRLWSRPHHSVGYFARDPPTLCRPRAGGSATTFELL